MALELPLIELQAPLDEGVFELPTTETLARQSSISKDTRVSTAEGYSDGFTEYLTLYAGYGGSKKTDTAPIALDTEKIPCVIEDGLIPAASEKAIDIPDGLHYVEPAEGLEAVPQSEAPSTKDTLKSRLSIISKYTQRPPAYSKNTTPQLPPLVEHALENAELEAELHARPGTAHATTQPPSFARAETLLQDLQFDNPRKGQLVSGAKSVKTSKSKFPLIPRRSLSRLFRRNSEKKLPYRASTLTLALQHAADSGSVSLVASLVTIGAKAVPITDQDQPTKYRDALSCAAAAGHRDVVDYLISADCGVDQDSIDAAFLEACYATQVDIAMRLVRTHGARLETRKMAEWERIMRTMPEEGSKLIVSDRSCYHALAIMPNSKERDRLLSFLVSCDDFNKDQVVHHTFVISRALATRADSSNKTFILQNQRISVHCYKYTAVSLFTSFGFINGVRLLLEYGIKTKYSTAEKQNLATLSGPESSILAKFPLSATTTPDSISCISDNNHLHCPMVSVELLGLLLCNGADPHVHEHTENDSTYTNTAYTLTTPFFRAIAGRNSSAINVLLGVGVSHETDDCVVVGRSLDLKPLGLAIDLDDVQLVQLLILNGWNADWIVGWGPQKANGSRQVVTGMELARKNRKTKVLALLRKWNRLDEEEDDEELCRFEREMAYGL